MQESEVSLLFYYYFIIILGWERVNEKEKKNQKSKTTNHKTSTTQPRGAGDAHDQKFKKKKKFKKILWHKNQTNFVGVNLKKNETNQKYPSQKKKNQKKKKKKTKKKTKKKNSVRLLQYLFRFVVLPSEAHQLSKWASKLGFFFFFSFPCFLLRIPLYLLIFKPSS